MCFLYKCIHNFIDIDIKHIISFHSADTSRTRLGQQVLSLRSVRFNSELAGLFFSNCVVKKWNILPNTIQIIHCCNKFVKSFKKLLYNFYIVKLTTTYDIYASTWVTVYRQAWNTFLFLSLFLTHPSRREAFTRCWVGVGPASQTVGQHWFGVWWASRVCWDAFFKFAANAFY